MAIHSVDIKASATGLWRLITPSLELSHVFDVLFRYKLWVDTCSEIFGGLHICAVKAIHGKDGKDYITEVGGIRSKSLNYIPVAC